MQSITGRFSEHFFCLKKPTPAEQPVLHFRQDGEGKRQVKDESGPMHRNRPKPFTTDTHTPNCETRDSP